MATGREVTSDDLESRERSEAASTSDGERLEPLQWLVQQIDEIFVDVTNEEWAEWPEDASEQLDHYLYGSPKRETRKFKAHAPSSAPRS